MGMQRGFARTSMKRTRYGVAEITINPAWLKIYPTGVRKIIITLGVEVGITAEVRVKATADVAVGDFLYEATRGQRFYVYQLIPEQATVLLMCQQVPKFIGDEFDNLQVEGFWSQLLNGGSLSESAFAGQIELAPPVPVVQVATNGLFLYQVISGDFDVFARLAVTNNLSGLNAHYGYLGARVSGAAYLGAYIGTKGTNGASVAVRLDQYGTLAGQQDETTAAVVVNFVRLRRVGVVLHTYYSTNGDTNVPNSEDDWVELEGSGFVASSGADVELGLGCYITSNVPAGNRTISKYIRNFFATA
jgi:hypothetical protein